MESYPNYGKYLLFFKSKLGKRSFVLTKGTGRVFVSAPHSAEQTRDGRVKFAEYETGAIACVLHDVTGCPIICKTKHCRDDANRDEKSRYKTKVKKYIEKNGQTFLFDLHQMNSQRKEEICLGTGKGANISAYPNAVDIAKSVFEEHGFRVSVDEPFCAVHPYTVSAYTARETGACCLQIEINTKLVSKGSRECRTDDVIGALAALVEKLEHTEV